MAVLSERSGHLKPLAKIKEEMAKHSISPNSVYAAAEALIQHQSTVNDVLKGLEHIGFNSEDAKKSEIDKFFQFEMDLFSDSVDTANSIISSRQEQKLPGKEIDLIPSGVRLGILMIPRL